jgi:predicted RNA-binding Zn-ribbon protein involved in translation (DUF1610 family)
MWDSDALWLKAKTFIAKANALDHAHPDFGLWSSLALELLGRAALSRIHPALNADPKQETNLFYALGLPSVDQPRSIPAHSVSARLDRFIGDFGKKPHGALFDYMILQRNIELHTGEVAFANTNPDTWLPNFYATCKILCQSMGKTLADFLGDEVGAKAEKIVAAFAKGQEKAVKDKLSQHRKNFESKSAEERAVLAAEAERLSNRQHRSSVGTAVRDCPACGSKGVLKGEFIREHAPIFEAGELLIENEYLAADFRCPACGLHLKSIDEIGLAGIDLHFTEREATSLHERFQAEWGDEYENM